MGEVLTQQQEQAVVNRGGKLLVSAAAGSGKTKVLVDRLIGYIMDPNDPANIDDFLMITYTKAAASELRGKIATKLSGLIAANPNNRHLQRQIQRLYLAKISTVHGFCADILKEYSYRLDIPADFRVADESECIQLRKTAMDRTLETAYGEIERKPELQAFIDTQGLGRTDALIPEIIGRIYDSAMCHLSSEQWCKKCVSMDGLRADIEPMDTIWGKYLAEDLFLCLDQQIQAMTCCEVAVRKIPGLDKPANLLSDTVHQLQYLRDSATWDQIVSRKNIDYGKLVFSKKYDVPHITDQVKAVRNACKDILGKKLRAFSDSAQDVMGDMERSSTAARGLMALVDQFSQTYAKLKNQRHILDFSDLEHRALDLLLGKNRSGYTSAADEIGKRFREIMVDEYQDSNAVQDAIFTALTYKKQNLFMVGDVKQSIYQFRLADPGIFLEKYAQYVPSQDAQPGQGRKVLLTSNFRSGSGVIEAVNHVFSKCMSPFVGGLDYGEDEALHEGIPHCTIPGPEVELCCIDVSENTYEEEANFVVDRVSQLLDGFHFIRQGDSLRPITPDDIVILLRSPGPTGGYFEEALSARGIPCAGSGSIDLLQTDEIIVLRAILQILSNPRQDIPLIATLASPVFNFSANDLAKLRCVNKYSSIYDALVNSKDKKCIQFIEVLSNLREYAIVSNIPELLEKIFDLTRIDTVYYAMEDGYSKKLNLQTFYKLAVEFSRRAVSDLDYFLSYLETMEEKGLIGTEQAVSGCVTIMSIHKSKGLEFPVVFLCGLSRKFNKEDLKQSVLSHKELGLGLSCVDQKKRLRYPSLSRYAITAKINEENISEELRVLYVAMTRARDRLIMTYASDSLSKDIRDVALRMDLSNKELITANVRCPGEWVLYSALMRAEAGALFAEGDRPNNVTVSQIPWSIEVVSASAGIHYEANMETKAILRAGSYLKEELQKVVCFTYPYEAATKLPSKETATQRKGRFKDEEAAEHARPKQVYKHSWRKASFLDKRITGKDRGNAVHAVMQYIRFEACSDVDSVDLEIQRLVKEGFISSLQAQMVDATLISNFFSSDLGKRVKSNGEILREFKFSILDDAFSNGAGLAGEKILLQGVVDCAIIEDDGITIIDFKTDTVTADNLDRILEQYKEQVEIYASAMQRIYRRPIKDKVLYFFFSNKCYYL